MLMRSRDERLTHFIHVDPVSYPYRQAKTHPPVAISPVRHWRINEFLVWDDHGDIIVSKNDGAARADLPHLTGDARDFNAITDGDWPFSKNEQTADEVTRNVFQTEPETHAYRTREYRQRSEMNAGIVQNDDDPDDQHDVADDLRNGVLERTIKAALRKESVEKKTFRSRGKPEHRHQQRDQQENLNEAQIDCRKRRGPSQRNSRGIHRRDGEKDNGRQTQDRRDDRYEI